LFNIITLWPANHLRIGNDAGMTMVQQQQGDPGRLATVFRMVVSLSSSINYLIMIIISGGVWDMSLPANINIPRGRVPPPQ